MKFSAQASLQEYDERLSFVGKAPDALLLLLALSQLGVAVDAGGAVEELKQNSNPFNILFLVSKQRTSILKFMNTVQAYLVLLCFTDVV